VQNDVFIQKYLHASLGKGLYYRRISITELTFFGCRSRICFDYESYVWITPKVLFSWFNPGNTKWSSVFKESFCHAESS